MSDLFRSCHMGKLGGNTLTTIVPDQRIWAEADLKPHLIHTFKVSNDPMFEEKATDVIGHFRRPDYDGYLKELERRSHRSQTRS